MTPKNECAPRHMCVNCQTARDASCNPSNYSSFLVGFQYHFRRIGPVRAHTDGCLSVLYSRIPWVLAPWSVRNQLPLQYTDHLSVPGDPIWVSTQATEGRLSPMMWWHFRERIKSLPQAIGIRLGIARKCQVDDRRGCDASILST